MNTMFGNAQKLYLEKFKKNPFKILSHQHPSWPFLEKMHSMGYLGYVDLAIAQQLLRAHSLNSEAYAALICHLSMAARLGHLCVTVADRHIKPSIEEIWQSKEGKSLDHQSLANINALIIEACTTYSPFIIVDMESMLPNLAIPICKQNDRYYLQRYWMIESLFIDHFKSFSENSNLLLSVNLAHVKALVDEMQQNGRILPEQALAVLKGCQLPFTIISGGPGTGKTYTAGILLRALWQGLSQDQRKRCRFALAAPTGKAAAQLESSIHKAMQDIEDFPLLPGQTLHALLGMGKRSWRRSKSILTADVLLIDESSMIDAGMMGRLFESLKSGTRLILLGDKNQLPPVETGSLFADLVLHLQARSKMESPVVELKTCLRAELKAIVDLAEKINAGDTFGVFKLFEESTSCGIKYVECSETEGPKEIQRRLLNHALARFPLITEIPEDPVQVLKQFSMFRLLTPLRQGGLGVESLNALFFQASMQRMQKASCLVVPIMIVANQHRLELFNGEMGLLIKFPNDPSKDFAYLPSHEVGNDMRRIDSVLLPKYEYAYCISVHKSQGSEFEHVVMLLPEGAENFGRETLYTGVTRAKKQLEVWGSKRMLELMLSKQALRHSGVNERL